MNRSPTNNIHQNSHPYYNVHSSLSSPLSWAYVHRHILKLSMSGHSGEGDDIADVLQAGHEHDQTLESQAEPGMGD